MSTNIGCVIPSNNMHDYLNFRAPSHALPRQARLAPKNIVNSPPFSEKIRQATERQKQRILTSFV